MSQETRTPRPGAPRPPITPRGPAYVRLGHPGKRVRFARFLILFIFSIYATRLIDLQIIHASSLEQKGMSTRMQTYVLPALRGMITDINGVPIATTVMARNITTDQTKVKDPAGAAAQIAPIVGISVEKIQARLTGTKRFAYVAKQISPTQWRQVAALEIPGIFSESTTSRVYPAKQLGGNLVGYVGSEGHGLGGLEFSLDQELAGIDGKQKVEQVNGRTIPTSVQENVEPIDGKNVRLTIDRDIQALAERALSDRIKEADAEAGDVVVMDPTTGNILAMATYPQFDPNTPFKTSDKEKQNGAVTEAFEPGSTGKILTMAAVIEEGKANPLTKFTIGSSIKRGGTSFHDHDEHGTLHLTLNGVLAKSSNIGTIQASELIGDKKWLEYAKKFGIGEKSGLNFPGETGGILPDRNNPNQWSDTTFPTLAFGQGYSVNALQVASVYSTIANDGVRMTPRLVDGFQSPDGTYTQTPVAKGTRVVSATTAKTVREMLESVIGPGGTAPSAKIPGYRVAGKTGTANRSTGSGYSGYTASFVGFAPAEKPALVVAVMIHNPKNGHFGSTISAPVFKTVMMYALAQQKIAPSTTKQPKIAVEW